VGDRDRIPLSDELLRALVGADLIDALEAAGVSLGAVVEGASVEAVQELVAERGRRAAEQQRLMAAGEMGAGIVHEVRNLVTSIRGFAQVARRKLGDPDHVDDLLALIDRESGRCVSAVSNFLAFARQDTGERELLDPNDVVRVAVELVRHQMSVSNVQLAVDLAPDVPAVLADRSGLVQVLVNLALNAQQAMPGGGRVAFETYCADDGGAAIAVTDTGPGVDPAVADRIFEPFVTTKPAGQGTGLGLAVSARIARDHGGSLALDASAQGARFVLRLPPRSA
jgi:two-component system sensor histidine kinase HydH